MTKLEKILRDPPYKFLIESSSALGKKFRGEIDYPEWQKQILERVEIDEGKLINILLETSRKFDWTKQEVSLVKHLAKAIASSKELLKVKE